MAAIESATRVAAEAMGWGDRVGTLQPGRYADLIAVANDPLADISRARARAVRDEGRHRLQTLNAQGGHVWNVGTTVTARCATASSPVVVVTRTRAVLVPAVSYV